MKPNDPSNPIAVLIVEDDDAQRRILADLVRDEGFEPVVCANGAEALERFAHSVPPVAIVDQLLPDMTGIELLQHTGGINRGMRVIIYTGYGSFESARDAVNLGAFAYVEKLSDTRQLLSQVHRAVQQHMAEALSESEQRYRTIVEQIPAITYMLTPDPEPRLLYLSPQVERILGLSTRRFLEDAAEYDRAIHQEDRRRIRELRRDCLARQAPFSAEYRMVTSDGRTIWVHDDSTPVMDAAGRPLYHHGVMMDITRTQRAAEQAAQRQTQLEHALRVAMVGEMATSLAHELNQPFAAISNFAEACSRRLREGYVPTERLLPIIEDIATQANRAGQIIHRLREFVRKRAPLRKRADMNRIVTEAVQLFAAEARSCGVPVDMALTESLPAVLADAVQIQQVLLNLLRNGLDACAAVERDEHRLTVSTGLDGEGRVMASVADTGPGIAPDLAERLFEPFYTTKPRGLGMGLAICQTMMQLHGGNLWLENGEPVGAVARLTLPAELPEPDEDDTAADPP